MQDRDLRLLTNLRPRTIELCRKSRGRLSISYRPVTPWNDSGSLVGKPEDL